MKDLQFLIGLSIFIGTIWYINFQDMKYCEQIKGGVYVNQWFGENYCKTK